MCMFKFIDARLFRHEVRQTFKTSVLNDGLRQKHSPCSWTESHQRILI